MNKRQKGFTLIELVIVISIIAILAAIALPKYISMQTDARIAKMQAIFGSIRTAAVLAKARCELDRAASNAAACAAVGGGTVSMDGANNVDMVNFYPAATATGIDVAANLEVNNEGLTIAGAGPRTFTANGVAAANVTTCRITYNAAAANVAPVITIDVTNCN